MPQLYRHKGGEILVNTETANNQASPSNAVLAGGGFIVAWQDASNAGTDSSVSAVRVQRFDADGNKAGGEFLVNSTITGSQGQPIVAALPSGRSADAGSCPTRKRVQATLAASRSSGSRST